MGNKKKDEEELNRLFKGDLSYPLTEGTTGRAPNKRVAGPQQQLDTKGTFKSPTYAQSKKVPTGYSGKKELPLSKSKRSVKQGSPRTYEDSSRINQRKKGIN